MPETQESAVTSDSPSSYRRLSTAAMDDSHRLGARDGTPTFRGWVIGIVSCAVLAALIPFFDNVLKVTRTSLNLLPATSVVLLLGLVILFNMGLSRLRSSLRLSRADLTLIFCMTILVNPLPGYGFMNYLTAAQMGPYYYARPENQWVEHLHPILPKELSPQDPTDPNDPVRPVTWFYSGLPQQSDGTMAGNWRAFTQIPWAQLAGPYALWCIALVFVLGMFFAISALLHREWSDRERLPFPLAQVPESMLEGLYDDNAGSQAGATGMAAEIGRKPFFSDSRVWIGIVLAFAVHGWNFFDKYAAPNWVQIPMRITHIDSTYLTETPFRYLQPMTFAIIPSVIAFMFMVSLEVSFSIWFFFLVVFKIGAIIAITGFALGATGGSFTGEPVGPTSLFNSQGVGALFAMVLAALFRSRGAIVASIKQALGTVPKDPNSPTEHQFSFSPRILWIVLITCFVGSVGWLIAFGVTWPIAAASVILLLMISAGAARMVAEGGVVYIKCQGNPSSLLQSTLSPATMGAKNMVVTGLWGKVFEFDYYRMSPMINIIGSLHLSARAKMKPTVLLAGLSTALLVTFVVSFFSFNYITFTDPGGAANMGWAFKEWPNDFYGRQTASIKQIKAYETKMAEAQKTGIPIPTSDIPDAAKVDTWRVTWIGVGMVFMTLFLFLRTRVFWWPHPIGYVMWMGMQSVTSLWFSYFLGWLIKFMVVKFGGQSVYLNLRRFMLGIIVGEALAVVFWTLIAWYTGTIGGTYSLEYN